MTNIWCTNVVILANLLISLIFIFIFVDLHMKANKSLLKYKSLTHYHTMLHIYSCGKQCKKRRNCLQQTISPFLTKFSTLISRFKFTLKCHLQFVSIWTSLKFCFLETGKVFPTEY